MARDERTEAGRALEIGQVLDALRVLRDRLLSGGVIPADLALDIVEEADAAHEHGIRKRP